MLFYIQCDEWSVYEMYCVYEIQLVMLNRFSFRLKLSYSASVPEVKCPKELKKQ